MSLSIYIVQTCFIQCLYSIGPWTLEISKINERLDTMEKTQIQIVDTLLELKQNQELILANQCQTSPTPQPLTSSTPRPQTSSTPRPQTSSTPRPQTSSTPQPQTSSTPRPLDHLSPLTCPPPNLPIGEIVNALPSSAINKDSLSGIEEVIDHYPKLHTLCKAGALACKLAREAIFGEEILKQCTPKGNRNLPGLPSKELERLKRVMFIQYPQLWRTPVEFEPVWQRCLEAIQQASKRLRLPHK